MPGQKWRDNDPRYREYHGRDRIVEVISVTNLYVIIRNDQGRESRTAIDRFGKKGRIGFTRVDQQEGERK